MNDLPLFNRPKPKPIVTTDAFDWSKLSHDEARLLRVILPHRGKAQAIPVPEAAARAELPMRFAQDVVKGLIETHHVPIGSSSSAVLPGWYLCVEAAELESNWRALRSRALSILGRAKAFDARRTLRTSIDFYGQTELFKDGSNG